MSHLSTLIQRVHARLAIYKGNAELAAGDYLFRQAVRNLREYDGADVTAQERDTARDLSLRYDVYVQPLEDEQ